MKTKHILFGVLTLGWGLLILIFREFIMGNYIAVLLGGFLTLGVFLSAIYFGDKAEHEEREDIQNDKE